MVKPALAGGAGFNGMISKTHPSEVFLRALIIGGAGLALSALLYLMGPMVWLEHNAWLDKLLRVILLSLFIFQIWRANGQQLDYTYALKALLVMSVLGSALVWAGNWVIYDQIADHLHDQALESFGFKVTHRNNLVTKNFNVSLFNPLISVILAAVVYYWPVATLRLAGSGFSRRLREKMVERYSSWLVGCGLAMGALMALGLGIFYWVMQDPQRWYMLVPSLLGVQLVLVLLFAFWARRKNLTFPFAKAFFNAWIVGIISTLVVYAFNIVAYKVIDPGLAQRQLDEQMASADARHRLVIPQGVNPQDLLHDPLTAKVFLLTVLSAVFFSAILAVVAAAIFYRRLPGTNKRTTHL